MTVRTGSRPAAARRSSAARRPARPRPAAGRTGPARPRATVGAGHARRPAASRTAQARRPATGRAGAARRPAPRRGAAPPRRRPAARRRATTPWGETLRRGLVRARPGRRLSALLVVWLVLTSLLAWRLVTVQVVSADEYRALAERQSQRDIELPARRGKVYDRDGDPLAMSLAAATIYANPRALAQGPGDPQEVAERLAPLLGRDVGSILEDLREDAAFVYLARQVPRQVGEQVAALELPGVGVLEEPVRVYPAGPLAAQVVGFTGVDNTGLSGLEAQHDDILAGKPGRLRLEQAPGGVTIRGAPQEVEPAVAGTDVVLSIDREIQAAAERALADAVARYDAQGGSAVVLDVATGEVLAMANVPALEPTRTGEAEPYVRRNRALTDVFEPGSVNKVITAAAALEEGLVTPEEVFTVPGRYRVGSKEFSDSHAHETQQMTFAEIMEQSSNVGTIQVAQRLGPERLYEYLRKFGYGSSTGVGFPGESAGLLPSPDTWWDTSLPTIAIGQGVAATLLQVASVFETVASGGERIQPTLVRGTVGPDGRLEPAPPPQRERVVSQATADALDRMLVNVVEGEHGTGRLAAVPGYHAGGKTGTARKPSQTSRGYEQGAYIASFAGYAPVEDPALVTAVMLDEPTPIYGGITAAPVFSEIMQFALRHRRVPPSDPARVVDGTPDGADAGPATTG